MALQVEIELNGQKPLGRSDVVMLSAAKHPYSLE